MPGYEWASGEKGRSLIRETSPTPGNALSLFPGVRLYLGSQRKGGPLGGGGVSPGARIQATKHFSKVAVLHPITRRTKDDFDESN